MIDWKNIDLVKLENFESKAYRLCAYDNIHFDCSEKICALCSLCPLDTVTANPIEPETMARIYQMFLRIN